MSTDGVTLTTLVRPDQDMEQKMADCVPESVEVLWEFEAEDSDDVIGIYDEYMNRYYNDITDEYGNVLSKKSLLSKIVSWRHRSKLGPPKC